MGDHADDAVNSGLDQSWGWRLRRPRVRERSNQKVFREFAHPVNNLCKAGQRVVHIPSGVPGKVISTREI